VPVTGFATVPLAASAESSRVVARVPLMVSVLAPASTESSSVVARVPVGPLATLLKSRWWTLQVTLELVADDPGAMLPVPALAW